MKKLYIILFLISLSVQAQTPYEIDIPEHRYQIDLTNKIIICKIDVEKLPDLGTYSSVVLKLDKNYGFVTNPGKLTPKEAYKVQQGTNEFTLFFSIFPLLSITTKLNIVDEPKRLCAFVYADEDNVQTSPVGIELRGGSSQRYPKKTYDLEFWTDESGNESKNMQFGNLRKDDDWVLDALYNEPLRLRAFSSHQLWLDIHTLYYSALEEDAKSGADVRYVDLFLNNTYLGIYMLSEQVDKKQLQLKGYKDGLRGELYKGDSWKTGNTTFRGLPEFYKSSPVWGGYELKTPKPDEFIDWTNLYNFTDFVMNSELEDFRKEIPAKLNIDNAIDYFIFLNLLRATDNTGKNIYTAKYTKDEPYFFVPWDLDGVFGTNWQGHIDDHTEDILSNGLFDRLIHLTPDVTTAQRTADRWFELREGVLSHEALDTRLSGNYNLLKDNRVYQRESMVWHNYPYDEASKTYMDTWLSKRLVYLDDYFNKLLSVEATAGLADFKIYPNPTSNFVVVAGGSITDDLKYQIYNPQGQYITEGILDHAHPVIHFNNLPQGIYFLKLDQTVKKLVVE